MPCYCNKSGKDHPPIGAIAGIECYNCRQRGHMSKDCPYPKKKRETIRAFVETLDNEERNLLQGFINVWRNLQRLQTIHLYYLGIDTLYYHPMHLLFPPTNSSMYVLISPILSTILSKSLHTNHKILRLRNSRYRLKKLAMKRIWETTVDTPPTKAEVNNDALDSRVQE